MQAAWDALERNDFRFAEAAAREALARAPDDTEALYLLGSTLLFEGRYAEALAPLCAASAGLARRGVAYRLGHCHLALGDFAAAEQALRREAQAYPESANAQNTLGVALVNQGRRAEALAAFLAALRIDPQHVEAANNAGNALHSLGRDEEALPYLQSAVTAQPGLADAHRNLGLALHALRRYEEAAESFARALAAQPGIDYALGSLVWAELLVCRWRQAAAHIAALREQVRANAVVAAPFTLIAVSDSLAEQRQCAELHSRRAFGVARPPLWRGAPRAHARIRLAYVSCDFHQHATAVLMARLFELHDRARFEVIGASYGPDDGSPMRHRLMKAFDRFVDVRERDELQTARLLHELEVDIAVDLKGHTGNSRLGSFAYRPAPLQVSYLGYPGTVGAPFIDYVIADARVIAPGEERFYSEKIVRLPHSYQVNDATREIAAHTPSRAQAGLPEHGFVFCCFNNSYKVTPEFFAAWMRLLASVPSSVLWLLEDSAAARRNLEAAAREHGIDPSRLVFALRAPHSEHLARHRLADLFLDTLPYNAHTTASDALWAGLPVLTCRGRTFAGRVAASLLEAVGLPELITGTLAEYEALALRLARDKALLARYRERLARNRLTHPLFDTELFRRHMEAAYEAMWQRFERGQPPEHFSVPAER